MISPGLIQKLTFVAIIFEILHRLVIAIMNALRLVFDENYRKETLGSADIFGDDFSDINDDLTPEPL